MQNRPAYQRNGKGDADGGADGGADDGGADGGGVSGPVEVIPANSRWRYLDTGVLVENPDLNGVAPLGPIDIPLILKAPVLGLYGGQDGGIPLDTVDKMKSSLKQAAQAGKLQLNCL